LQHDLAQVYRFHSAPLIGHQNRAGPALVADAADPFCGAAAMRRQPQRKTRLPASPPHKGSGYRIFWFTRPAEASGEYPAAVPNTAGEFLIQVIRQGA
jgi:hypothetical protein